MSIKRLFISILLTTTGIVSSAKVPSGAYHLICAHDDGPSAGLGAALDVRHVQVVASESKITILMDGVTTLVRNDDAGGILFTLPYNEGVKGAAVAQAIFVGSQKVWEGHPNTVEGNYRIIWPAGEEKGRFVLVRDDERKG